MSLLASSRESESVVLEATTGSGSTTQLYAREPVHMKSISRREFSSGLAAGAASVFLGSCTDRQQSNDGSRVPQTQVPQTTDLKIQRYNELGNTGITVSDVTFGANAINEPGVIRYAFDRGVNLFDTAANYSGGVSEEVLGRGLQGVRDKAHIITKQGFSARRTDRRAITRTLEASLRRLQTDYVDGLFIHSMETMDALQSEAVVESLIRFKQEGKVRFTGFSTHNERRTLAECVKPHYQECVDVVMLRYNHMESEAIETLIAQMRGRGIGTIAMKTQAGGRYGRLKQSLNDQLSYPQAAIAWVLENGNIDCAVLTMDTFWHIDTYVAASGKALTRSDHAALRKYQDAVAHTYCRATCDLCELSCPHGVAISDVMRCAMYFEDYGQPGKAIHHYATLAASRKPLPCASCSGHCTGACPYGLQVRDTLLQTHQRLTV
jgi:aryl-alcohol dehydrogenase-like predicted oxidoreductase